ncbi:MAG: 50S ribosomal protein L25/general stress protein Ctc [Candidatus Desulfofervidus sp.]|nr:50S ribosomal protein L25/general stress protein Ctc [Candidatus Desulfofervidus sp.]
MGDILLKAQVREKTGKEISRKLRAQGLIPAILYGPSTQPIPLVVNPIAVLKVLEKEQSASSFLDLEITDGKTSQVKKALIKDVDFHPATDQLIHVDFYEITVGKELTLEVPIVIVGKAKGVEKGGILEQNLRELTISCLPKLVPSHIEIDVANLDIGDSIHVADISVAEGIKIENDPQVPVVTLVAPEEVKAEAEEEELEETAEA